MLGEVRGRTSRRLATALFVAVLVAGVAAAAAGPSGGITVSSDPSGATVKVDNVVRGVTPLDLRDLTPGSHRVAVSKAGYLDNMRVVEVTAGGMLTVDVRLTSTSLPAQETTTAIQEKKGSSKLKWLLIGGAGAGAAVAYVMLTKNSPPNPGTASVSPASGLAAGTSFAFSSSGASDPNGDALSYSWDFGDGGTATGTTATHVFNSGGTFTVRLTVSDGKASASTTTTATVTTLNGAWYSTSTAWAGLVGDTYTLSQNGANVTGSNSYVSSGQNTTGSVSVPLHVTLTVNYGYFNYTFTATVSSDLRTMTGTVSGTYLISPYLYTLTNVPMTLTKQ